MKLITLSLIFALVFLAACTPVDLNTSTAIPVSPTSQQTTMPTMLTPIAPIVKGRRVTPENATWEIVFDGGRIYTQNYEDSGTYPLSIYMKVTDGDEVIIADDAYGDDEAYLAENRLYYRVYSENDDTYKTCRIDIKRLGEAEIIDGNIQFATDEYLYYCKESDPQTIYRADADFRNSVKVFSQIDGERYDSAGHRVIRFDKYPSRDTADNLVTVFDQDGIALFEVATGRFGYRYFTYYRSLFWCEWEAGDTANKLALHRLNLDTWEIDIAYTTCEPGLEVCGVIDVDDEWAYLHISNYMSQTAENNEFIYRMPLQGGNLEEVYSWFWS